MSVATDNSYMLIQMKMSDISKALWDDTCAIGRRSGSITELYDVVLKADNSLNELETSLPAWLNPDVANIDWSRLPPYTRNLARTFQISFAHKRMQIHRGFFCKSMTDKRFYYSLVTCLQSARSLLAVYSRTYAQFEVEMWTIPTHAVSASIILTLHIISNRTQDVGPSRKADSSSLESDAALVQECLNLLQSSLVANQISRRGVTMIQRLLSDTREEPRTTARFDEVETEQLISEVEELVRRDLENTNTTFGECLDDVLGFFELYPPTEWHFDTFT